MGRKRQIELYEETRQDIKRIARELMAQRGTNGLSMRAIARELEMTAPALYHYYENQDALITALIVDAFDALAVAVQDVRDALADESAGVRLLGALNAYRQQALAHPVDFQLIYGNPIPGYAAPPEITVPASTRSLRGLVTCVYEALQAGEWVPQSPYDQIPEETEAQLKQVLEETGAPPDLLTALYLGTIGWSHLHGIITLEMFRHLPPVVGDMDSYFEQQMVNLLRVMGLRTI